MDKKYLILVFSLILGLTLFVGVLIFNNLENSNRNTEEIDNSLKEMPRLNYRSE